MISKLRHGAANEVADNGGKQERERHIRSGLEGDDRIGENHVGRRRDVGNALENELRKTERIASQLGVDGLSRHPGVISFCSG
jgi:hypothetical protein